MSDDPITINLIPVTGADNAVQPYGVTAPADPNITQPVIIEDTPEKPAVKAYYVPNRHDRRRSAAKARRERKQKGKR
ncbi:MAG TPA: hypothetical protein VIH42_08190 [Thermoguttaceae bacterium]